MNSKLFLGIQRTIGHRSYWGTCMPTAWHSCFVTGSGAKIIATGLFVPLISLFLIWQARHRIAVAGIENSWWGLAVISAGLFSLWDR